MPNHESNFNEGYAQRRARRIEEADPADNSPLLSFSNPGGSCPSQLTPSCIYSGLISKVVNAGNWSKGISLHYVISLFFKAANRKIIYNNIKAPISTMNNERRMIIETCHALSFSKITTTCQKIRIAANPVGINNSIGGANARPENV